VSINCEVISSLVYFLFKGETWQKHKFGLVCVFDIVRSENPIIFSRSTSKLSTNRFHDEGAMQEQVMSSLEGFMYPTRAKLYKLLINYRLCFALSSSSRFLDNYSVEGEKISPNVQHRMHILSQTPFTPPFPN